MVTMNTADESSTKDYCRACGPGKGHRFGSCNNAKALRGIIESQDVEIDENAERARQLDKVKAELNEADARNGLLQRIMFSLLDLAELRREAKK